MTAAAGHIVSILLIDRDERLSITILSMKSAILNFSNCGTNHSNIPSSRIRFIHLPDHEPSPSLDPRKNFTSMIKNNKQHVKEIVSKLSHKLAGIVLDLMCTPMMDVAKELGVPSYLYYAAGATFLGMPRCAGKEPTEFDELALPSMANPLPVPKSLPSPLLYKEESKPSSIWQESLEKQRLEPYAVNSLAADNRIPPVYPVGPLLNLKGNGHNEGSNNKLKVVMQWLDDQLTSSVVFLCFRSMGSFNIEQVKEIAYALENSGHRFLSQLIFNIVVSAETSNGGGEAKDRITHRATHPLVGLCRIAGGILCLREYGMHGDPIGAWPLHAEQKFNALELVMELGLAVEIRLDYRSSDQHHKAVIVDAGDIERGIRSLMDRSKEERMKLLNEMREYSKKALEESGSSYSTIGRLIEDIIGANNH
ncbi:hypothetical protein Tsubulata_044220 [Turnera subulata]|uniref:Uncharacterized protein n=1 Tax=Turnera subulata TaxID=218843 RepID=A0A9Q0FK71_9ROSI|nr:hypothetical protein Tsubulata_044220 [Turnera subulata]